MKGSVFTILTLALFAVLPGVYAVQININSNYSQGETIIGNISGNFIDQVQPQNILLYEGHVRGSFIPYVQKIGNLFYFYGQLSNKPAGNYSIVLSGVTYMDSNAAVQGDITKSFTVTNSTADFSVTPGFIYSSEGFSISVESESNNSLTVNYMIKNSPAPNSKNGEISLQPGQTKSVSFPANLSSLNQSVVIEFSGGNTTYSIPVFSPLAYVTTPPASGITIDPSMAQISLPTDENATKYFYVKNFGQSSENVSFSVSDSLKPYVSVLNESVVIGPNSSGKVFVSITPGNKIQVLSGQILANSSDSRAYFKLTLDVTKNNNANGNGSSVQNSSPSEGTTFFATCSQLNGQICNENQTCLNNTESTSDGICCLGTCQLTKSPNNAGKIVGWTLAIILLALLGYFLFKRYSHAKRRSVNLLSFTKKS